MTQSYFSGAQTQSSLAAQGEWEGQRKVLYYVERTYYFNPEAPLSLTWSSFGGRDTQSKEKRMDHAKK